MTFKGLSRLNEHPGGYGKRFLKIGTATVGAFTSMLGVHEGGHDVVRMAYGRESIVEFDEDYRVPLLDGLFNYDDLDDGVGGHVKITSDHYGPSIERQSRFDEMSLQIDEMQEKMREIHAPIREKSKECQAEARKVLSKNGDDFSVSEACWDEHKEMYSEYKESKSPLNDLVEQLLELKSDGYPNKIYWRDNPMGFTEDLLFTSGGMIATTTVGGVFVSSGISDIRRGRCLEEKTLGAYKTGVGSIIIGTSFGSRTDLPHISSLISTYVPEMNFLPESVRMGLYALAIAGSGLAFGHSIKKGAGFAYSKMLGGFDRVNTRMSKRSKRKSKKPVAS